MSGHVSLVARGIAPPETLLLAAWVAFTATTGV
jgi:hypothetical protein